MSNTRGESSDRRELGGLNQLLLEGLAPPQLIPHSCDKPSVVEGQPDLLPQASEELHAQLPKCRRGPARQVQCAYYFSSRHKRNRHLAGEFAVVSDLSAQHLTPAHIIEYAHVARPPDFSTQTIRGRSACVGGAQSRQQAAAEEHGFAVFIHRAHAHPPGRDLGKPQEAIQSGLDDRFGM